MRLILLGSLLHWKDQLPAGGAPVYSQMVKKQGSPIQPIGRERKIAVEKGRPSTRQLISGVPPVTFSAGSSESDHSGVAPVKMRWSGT